MIMGCTVLDRKNRAEKNRIRQTRTGQDRAGQRRPDRAGWDRNYNRIGYCSTG
jgi:hypothetical protein